MTYYLDLGAQRVQDWILATPKLDHLRGASNALAVVTSADPIGAWLATAGLPGVQVAPDGGDVDGVVVLTCPDAGGAAAASAAVLQHLGRELPRVQWAGWWTEAETYLAAYAKAESGDVGVHRVSALPALNEVPVIEQCDECGQEPRPGRDCAVRVKNSMPPEHLLYSVDGDWPTDFNDLAARGGLGAASAGRDEALGRRDSRNHLALIKADGNKIGQVFAAIAEHAASLPSLGANAVADLNAATEVAVEQAAGHLLVTDADAVVKGALPHYVGGDDVLVSVPAARAWRFAAQLGREFEALRGTWHDRLADDLPTGKDDVLRARIEALIDEVSLGIGVVFARSTYPIAAAHRIAGVALGEAKRAAAGSYSAIAWVDLSAEGVAGTRPDGTWNQAISVRDALDQLNGTSPEGWADAADLFEVPPAGRARLAQELREARDAADAKAVALAWCKATGRTDALLALAEKDPYALLSLVSRARWWPTAAVEEASR